MSDHCIGCGQPFITEWPHHCRKCGILLCGDCIDDGYCSDCKPECVEDEYPEVEDV